MAPDVNSSFTFLRTSHLLQAGASDEGFFDLTLSVVASIAGYADLGRGMERATDAVGNYIAGQWMSFFAEIPRDEHKSIILELLDHMESLINEQGGRDYFSTPKELATVMTDYLKGANPTSIYDPSAGSGGLLAEAARIGSIRYVRGNTRHGISEKLMRLRLFLLNRAAAVHAGHFPTAMNPDEKRPFDVVISNPPYGGNLQGLAELNIGEEWFSPVQKINRIDGAILGHILTYLADRGKAAVLLPTFFLSGPRVEGFMRQILTLNLLDGVVLLPAGIFEGSPVAPALFLFSKGRRQHEERVFLADASKEFYRRGKQVKLKTERLTGWIKKIQARDYRPEEDLMILTVDAVISRGCDLQPATYRPKEEIVRVPAEVLLKECQLLEKKIKATRRRIDELTKWER